MVKSEQIYAPQTYLEEVTGNLYFLKNKIHPAEEIQQILKADKWYPYELWDYPLTEIDHIVENNLDVVLVNCSHYEGDSYISEYRWFEVPEWFGQEDEE